MKAGKRSKETIFLTSAPTRSVWLVCPKTTSGLTQVGLARHLGDRDILMWQHYRNRWESERSAVRVSGSVGGRYKDAGLGEERSKIPAGRWSGESPAKSRHCPRSFAEAHENDNQHTKHNRLQQQTKTSGSWSDKSRSHKEVNPETKKAGLQLIAGDPQKSTHQCNSPSLHSKRPLLHSKRPPPHRNGRPSSFAKHEVNKTAVIVGALTYIALR